MSFSILFDWLSCLKIECYEYVIFAVTYRTQLKWIACSWIIHMKWVSAKYFCFFKHTILYKGWNSISNNHTHTHTHCSLNFISLFYTFLCLHIIYHLPFQIDCIWFCFFRRNWCIKKRLNVELGPKIGVFNLLPTFY